MTHYIAYGLLLATSELLEHVRKHFGEVSIQDLAQKLLKEIGKEFDGARREKMEEDTETFFLRDLNLLERLDGLAMHPLKSCKYVFIGNCEQLNPRWQDPSYLYTVENIFPADEQKFLRKTMRKYALPGKRCRFYFSLEPFDLLSPCPAGS